MASLLDYCDSESQKEIIELLESGLSQRQVAKKLGKGKSTISDSISRVKAKAAKKGWSPEHDMTKTVPDGYAVKGTSTLYDEFGKPKLQWVKTNQDHERQIELMQEIVSAMKEEITPASKSPACQNKTVDDLLNCYVITDYHIGMLSWHEESGTNWNTEVSEEFLERWFAQAIKQAPEAHTGIFSEIGDWLHSDGLDAVTPTSGHPLDSDSRFQKMVRISIRLSRKIISMLLEKHQHVHVVMAEGNHNLAGSVWMREMFSELYRDEPRVTVDINADPYYCYEWGNTSLFWHHGHKRKPANIDHVFASKFREVFGRTKYSYAHMGHMHHIDMKETSLMVVEQHRTLAAPDAHASRGGYCSNRSAPVITYSKKYGEVGRQTISPEMIQ